MPHIPRFGGAWTFCALVFLSAAPFSLSAPVSAGAEDRAGALAPAGEGCRPSSVFSTDYVKLLWSDVRGVACAPAQWDSGDWKVAAVWGGAIVGAATLDREVHSYVTEHLNTSRCDSFSREWGKLGAAYSYVGIGALEAYGLLRDDRRARAAAMDAISATVIATGIITPTLKLVVGRSRPRETSDPFTFNPFSVHRSFPSGHTTQAFAMAAVVSGHYTEWWQQSLAYGAASLVGVARIQQNEHWCSDVVVGAAIGWAVGHAVVHRHNSVLPKGVTLAPWFGKGTGLLVMKEF